MGQPVGSIFQVAIESLVNNQRLLNVLHYRVEEETTEADIQAETENLAGQVLAFNGIVDKMLDCMSNTANVTQVTAQCIRNTRFVRAVVEDNQEGNIVSPCAAQNLAAVITKRTTFSGRWAVGSFHLGGLPVTAYQAGVLDNAFKALVQALADELLDPIVIPAVGGTYIPVLLHPVGQHGGSTVINAVEVQDQVRVMRRRTVGLGI